MIETVLHSLITFIDLVALSALIGVALCLVWAGHAGYDEAGSSLFLGRIRRLLAVCLIALVVSSVGNLVQRTMEMSGLGIPAILPLLPTVLFKTHYGRIGLVRAAGVGVALVVGLAGRRYLNSRFVAVFMMLAAAGIAFSRSATSHAADFGDLSLQELSDWLHLLASSSWAGVLIAAASVFSPSVVAEDGLQQQIAAGIGDRLYVFFGPMLSVLVLTGFYNAWVEVGSFGVLLTTPYGIILSVKLALFLLLVSRYIALPPHGQDERTFAISFLRRTRIDAVLVSGVLLCAAMLSHNVTARHFAHVMPEQGYHMDHGYMQKME